jgi:hypothetical protein
MLSSPILTVELIIFEKFSKPKKGIEKTEATIIESNKLRKVTSATIPNFDAGFKLV